MKYLDRYAARCVNFVPVVTRIAVLAARSAARATGNQPRALFGYQGLSPWLVGGAGILFGVLLWTSSASAHHALQAQFDTEKTLSLKGTLARIEWINPHAYFWFDVKDETGKVTQWGAETVGPAALRQAGFLRGPASFRVGETYTFEGFAARDGGSRLFTSAIHFPDGRKVQIWFGDAQGNK